MEEDAEGESAEEITKGDALTKEQEAATKRCKKPNSANLRQQGKRAKGEDRTRQEGEEELQLACRWNSRKQGCVRSRDYAVIDTWKAAKVLLEDVKKNHRGENVAWRRKKRHDRPQEDVLKSLKDAKNALKVWKTQWVTRLRPCNTLKRSQRLARGWTQTANE